MQIKTNKEQTISTEYKQCSHYNCDKVQFLNIFLADYNSLLNLSHCHVKQMLNATLALSCW